MEFGQCFWCEKRANLFWEKGEWRFEVGECLECFTKTHGAQVHMVVNGS